MLWNSCTALASNREGGVGFDLHFRSVRCSRGVVVSLPWIYLTLLVRTMVLGHLLLVQVFKVQTRNMTLLLELTFQVCCRLQQNRMDCRFQTIMTQMWLCSQHGSHHLVVNWRCHGKAVFGTSFGPERFCPGDDDTWYREASSFSCRTTESWSTGWYCRAKGDGQTDCWGQKLFATYQKCSGENLARRTWSDMGDIHPYADGFFCWISGRLRRFLW